MTRIEIADDQWQDWPSEPGGYLYGSTHHVDYAMLMRVTSRLYADWFEYDDCCEMTRQNSKYHGYRYARVELPTVPSTRSSDDH